MKNALKVVVGAAVAVVAINALFFSPETVDDPLKDKEAEGEEFAEFGSVTAETKAKAEAAAAEKAVAAEKAAARHRSMLSTWRGEEKVAAAEKAAAWHAAKKAADAEALIERRQKFAETKKQAESNSQDGSASGRWRQGQVQIKLGLMYAKGDGVDQDKGEAAKWFRRAKFHLLNEEMRLLISATLTDQTFELALSDATPIVKQKANEWFNPDSWQSRETSAPDFAPESGKVDVPDENLAKVYSLIGLLLLDEDKEKEDLKESLEWFGKAEKAELDRNKAVETNEKLRKKWEDYVRNVPDPFRVPGKVPGKSKSKPILPGGPLHPPTSIKIPKPNLPPSLIRRVPRIPIRNRPAPVPRR